MNIFRKNRMPAVLAFVLLIGAGCAGQQTTLEPWELPDKTGMRDNTPVCLVPEMSGTDVRENELARIDCSNAPEGYVFVQYLGKNEKVKLQITGSDTVTYTYTIHAGDAPDVFPLSSGDGTYQIGVYENIQLNQYALAFATELDVRLHDAFLPFLYPNQYVKFEAGDEAIALGRTLAAPADDDLEVVSNVYNYVIRNISYDTQEAETVTSGYLPDIDEVLETKKGICLDYAALMTAILRSQKIPTRMEVGYAGIAYHAWISVHIDGVGWVNGLIEFDGTSWSLMDPTFAASTAADELKTYIGEGDNYETKYVY